MKSLSVSELNKKFRHNLLTEKEILELHDDPRKGVQAIIKRYHKRKETLNAQKALYTQMSVYEKELSSRGFQLIAGIDEAGRGPLAGPVSAAAVVLNRYSPIYGLNDSKKLSKRNRSILEKKIKQEALAYSVELVGSKTIDKVNILEATKKAMESAIKNLIDLPDYLLIDAEHLQDVRVNQTSIINGDRKSISIAAASILAKEARDKYMIETHQKYPKYGFLHNMGYGTGEHIEALKKYGPCPEHRFSFAPVARYVR